MSLALLFQKNSMTFYYSLVLNEGQNYSQLFFLKFKPTKLPFSQFFLSSFICAFPKQYLKQITFVPYNTTMRATSNFHALDAPSSKYRQSLSILSSQLIRNSLSMDSTAPCIYRESLGSTFKTRNTMALQVLEYLRQQFQQDRIQKEKESFSNLKSTLSQLQSKIHEAKRHFGSSMTILDNEDIEEEIAPHDGQNQKTLTYSGELNTTRSSGKIQFCVNEMNSNSQSQKNKKYYVNNLASALDGRDARALDHMHFSLRVLKNYYKVATPTFADIQEKKVYLPKSKAHIGKKTLILDIDQTLIHCEQNPSKPYDIAVPIQIENGSTANAYITIRPYAISFLKRMSKHFEIISFTASHQSYADAVLDEIDPQRQYIKHRLYRKNCIQIYDKIFVKDLRVINRDLSSIVLVDNAPYSYIFQLQNGIPILPYYTGEDAELIRLEKYLQEMLKCQDVREFNKKHFQLHRYCNFDDSQDLIKELYL